MLDGATLRDDQIGAEIRAYSDLSAGQHLVQLHHYYRARPIVRVVSVPAGHGRTGISLGHLILERVDNGYRIEYASGIQMPSFWHRILP